MQRCREAAAKAPYDLEELGRSIELLLAPGCVYELRALGTREGTASGYFDDFLELGAAAARWSGQCDGVYLVLNPVLPRLLHRSRNQMKGWVKKGSTSTDEDVVERRWLLVDMDPVRPAGLSSTDEEHGWAFERALAVREFLRGLGKTGIVWANSGNGSHLLLPFVQPNTPEAKDAASAILQTLGKRFSDERVKVDPTTFNASRLCKLYGTLSCKGTASAENPHRLSGILEVDE